MRDNTKEKRVFIPQNYGYSDRHIERNDLLLMIQMLAEHDELLRGNYLLTALYQRIQEECLEETSTVVTVATKGAWGFKHIITPIEAYLLHKHELLSEEKTSTSYGHGMTDYSLQQTWRELDMMRFRQFLDNASLSTPEAQ